VKFYKVVLQGSGVIRDLATLKEAEAVWRDVVREHPDQQSGVLVGLSYLRWHFGDPLASSVPVCR
jgi:hypothetical protein